MIAWAISLYGQTAVFYHWVFPRDIMMTLELKTEVYETSLGFKPKLVD